MIKVSLREKKIGCGKVSLYLDFYPPIPHPTEAGKTTRRQFLNMYVHAKGAKLLATEKQFEEEIRRKALAIRAEMELRLNQSELQNEAEKELQRIKLLNAHSFIDYLKDLTKKRKESNAQNWQSAIKHFTAFCGGGITFGELDKEKIEKFKDYLLNTDLHNNSALSYYNKIKAALKQAYEDGFLQQDLAAKVSNIKEQETVREHLTADELSRLAATHCENDLMKRAALFSALTGLRFSDIAALKWQNVRLDNGEYSLHFIQQKTKGVQVHYISQQAYDFTGGRDNPAEMPQTEQVFNGLKYSAYYNKDLYKWIGLAGIKRNITFHKFRHTYAVLQLEGGTDIYTVSKLMGHKELKTTQVYADVVNDTKRKAANTIKIHNTPKEENE